ncbi:MAG: diacylglycerol kinase [Bacteroidetes bacterium]|nr:MAG: diacylglycerol kinase [Bacteroidota bacterium]
MGYIKKRFFAFKVAFQGIYLFIKEGAHAKIHLIATLTVMFMGWFFNITKTEWILSLVCVAIVLSLEAINSAIEYLVDLASPDFHPLAKKSKDIAAAAVLIAAIFALIIGLLIFLPYLNEIRKLP